MMYGPFSRQYMNSPSHFTYGPSARGIPVQNVRTTTAPSPKVVSIPVRFVGSERNRSESALKIQKLVRGFLVRKSVKKIASINRDVVQIEKMISKKKTVELIRKDSREKLRVNEALMNLLLKLDSVRGVYSGIRDCRKTVIKKAIGLQEVVDAISSGDESLGSIGAAESCDRQTLITRSDALESCDQTLITRGDVPATKQTFSESEYEHYTPDCAKIEDNQTTEAQTPEGSTQTSSEEESTIENIHELGKETVISIPKENQSETFTTLQASNEGDDGNFAVKQEETMVGENPNVVSRCCGAVMEEKKRSDDLLEKMMDENAKMMCLIADLNEKNELQTQLLTFLTQRVDLLEKAFVCDKLRRKKKKRATTTLECL